MVVERLDNSKQSELNHFTGNNHKNSSKDEKRTRNQEIHSSNNKIFSQQESNLNIDLKQNYSSSLIGKRCYLCRERIQKETKKVYFKCRTCKNYFCNDCLEAFNNPYFCPSSFWANNDHPFDLINLLTKEVLVLKEPEIDLIYSILDTDQDVPAVSIRCFGQLMNIGGLIYCYQQSCTTVYSVSQHIRKRTIKLLSESNRITILRVNEKYLEARVVGKGGNYTTTVSVEEKEGSALPKVTATCTCKWHLKTQGEGLCYHKVSLLFLYKYARMVYNELAAKEGTHSVFEELKRHFRQFGFLFNDENPAPAPTTIPRNDSTNRRSTVVILQNESDESSTTDIEGESTIRLLDEE